MKVKVSSYLLKVFIFHHLLLVEALLPELAVCFDKSVSFAAFQIEDYSVCMIVGELDSVLHDNEVKTAKDV